MILQEVDWGSIGPREGIVHRFKSPGGEEGVVGRIDALATALFARMTVDEVHNLDLAYAPPFGPVYDAIIDVCGKAALEL